MDKKEAPITLQEEGGLSTGSILGIVYGLIIVVVVLILLLVMVVFKKKSKEEIEIDEELLDVETTEFPTTLDKFKNMMIMQDIFQSIYHP